MCQSDDSISIVSPERFVSLRNQHKGTKLFPEAPISPLKRRQASAADLNTSEFIFPSGTNQSDFPPPLADHSQGQGFCEDFTPTSSTSAESLSHYRILTMNIICWTGC